MEGRKRYSRKFQRMAVARMRTCESVGELAKELGVTQRCLYKWRTKLETLRRLKLAKKRRGPSTHALAHRKEILQLKRLLAEKAMEEHRCQLVVVSRRGFYRSLRQRELAEEEMEVRSLIQKIALEHRRRYGYRRITAEWHRRGVQVDRKKVARMMRDDNLLAIQPKRYRTLR